MIIKTIQKTFFFIFFLFSLVDLRAQCTWTTVSAESFEYTNVIPHLLPGKVYQDSPQTTALANCVRTGNRGMYLNIINGETGLLYSRPYTSICTTQNYRFSFSANNASSSLPNPNITVNIYDNNNAILSTTTLTLNNAWSDIVMPQFISSTTTIRFEIVTNIAGGPGNDVGFDDIKLSICGPNPQTSSIIQCAGTTNFDLYPTIINPTLSNSGVWTGPSALQNGYLGTFNPAVNGNGAYSYKILGVAGCSDSVANINVQLTQTPQLNAIAAVNNCGPYTLPAITGTVLAGNEKYYTLPNGGGTVLPVGSQITTNQTIYAYGGAVGCSDEESFLVTISNPVNAGSDNGANYCGAGPVVNLGTFLAANATPGGVWAETTNPISGAFNATNQNFNTVGLFPGSYTFTYSLPANGSCPADQALFSIGISNFPAVQLGSDTTLCTGQNLLLNAASAMNYDSYLWNNSSTNPTRIVNAPGTYKVKVGILGNDQIVNGDFESGTTGFSTDYTLGSGGNWGLLSNPSTYAITNSPNLVHDNFMACADHTPTPGTQMLVVNGSGIPGTNVWCQTVPVQPNTDYQFGTWITNALNEFNVAQLQFSINGSPLGNIFTTSTTGCNWQQFFRVWNSGSSTSATICILNQNTNGGGNDFAIDDITFRPVCYSEDSIVVSYSAFPVVNLGIDTNLCSGNTLTLDAQNPGSTYLWSGASTNQTLVVDSTGTYQVTVTNAAFCQKTDAIVVTFEDPKDAGLDTLLSICVTNGTIDLNTLLSQNATTGGVWKDIQNTANGGLSANGNFNFSQLNGLHEASYVVSGVFCPNDTSLITIDVKSQPNAGLNGDSSVCNTTGDLVDLNTLINPITNIQTGVWEEVSPVSSNQFTPANGNLDLSNLSAGNYVFNYILSALQPCLNDTAKVTVRVVENPTVNFVSDTLKGCSPLEVQFTNTSVTSANSTFFWDLGDGTSSSTQNPALTTYVGAGCYDISLTVTANNLCSATFSALDLICVDPNPVADFTFSPKPAYSDDPTVTFTNNSTLNQSNHWSFGDDLTSNLENPKHVYPLGEVANYLAELIVISNAGCVDTVRNIVQINGQTVFYVPNAFTPNGDEFNTIFNPVMTTGFDPTDYTFKIFNRWGELVFETHDHTIGWDGTYQGSLVQDGTYIWILDFKHISEDNRFFRKGTVALIR